MSIEPTAHPFSKSIAADVISISNDNYLTSDLFANKKKSDISISCDMETSIHCKDIAGKESNVERKSEFKNISVDSATIPYSDSKTADLNVRPFASLTQNIGKEILEETCDLQDESHDNSESSIRNDPSLQRYGESSEIYTSPENLLINKDSDIKTVISEVSFEDPLDSLLNDMSEFLLEDLEQNSAIYDNSTSFAFQQDMSEIDFITWMNKEEYHTIPQNAQSTLQASFFPILPNSHFLPFIDSETDIFIQKISEMIESLQEIIMDSEKTDRAKKLEVYILQIIKTVHQWIEYLEVRILNLSDLTKNQYVEECKEIENELIALQQSFTLVKNITSSLNFLSSDVQQQLLSQLSNIEKQINTTKEFATSYFAQRNEWNQKGLKLDENQKHLNGELQTLCNKLEAIQSNRSYEIPLDQAYEIKEKTLEYISQSEMISFEKQKLFLNWPKCDFSTSEENLSWCRKIKMLAFINYRLCKECYINTSVCFESLEWLQGLSDIMFIKPTPIHVKNSNDFLQKCNYLKEHFLSMTALLESVKYNFKLSQRYLTKEKEDEFEDIIYKASVTISEHENMFKEWNQCYLLLIELLNCIQNSNYWIEEKNAVIKKKPCSIRDLTSYISFIESVRYEVLKYRHQIKYVKNLIEKVRYIVDCECIEESYSKLISSFTNLQQNINVKADILFTFANLYPQVQKDLVELQNWLVEADSRQKYVCQEIKNCNNVSTLFENLRSITKLEVELESSEDISARIKDIVDDEDILKNFDFDKSLIDSIISKRSQMRDSFVETSRRLTEKIFNCEKKRIKKHLALWLEDVAHSHDLLNVKNIENVSDMRKFKVEIHKCLKDICMIDNILRKCKIDQVDSDNADIEADEYKRKKMHLNEDIISISKEKMEFQANNIDTFIFQFIEYQRLIFCLNFKLEEILSSFENLKLSINSYNNVLSIQEEIQAHENYLFENDMVKAVKNIGEEMCQIINSDFVVKFVATSQEKVETLLSQINLIMPDTRQEVQLCINKWKSYKNAVSLFDTYVSDQQLFLNICDSTFVNEDHLSSGVAKLQNALENTKIREEMIKNCTETSNILKEFVSEVIQQEIEDNVHSARKKWQDFCKELHLQLEKLQNLSKTWTEISEKLELLSQWLLQAQNKVSSMPGIKLSHMSTVEQILKELQINEEILKLVQYSYSQLRSNSLVDSTALEDIQRKISSTASEMKSLKNSLICDQDFLLPMNVKKNKDEELMQDVATYLKNLQKNYVYIKKDSKGEIEQDLKFVKDELENIANKYACLQFIGKNIDFRQEMDNTFAKSLVEMMHLAKSVMSTFSTSYLKLMEAYRTKCSIIESIKLCLEFLKNYKSMKIELQSSQFQNSYLETIQFFMKYRMFDIYIHGYRNMMKHIIRNYHQKSFSELSNVRLLSALKLLKHNWETLESIHVEKFSKIERAICLWENYLRHFHYSNIFIYKLAKEIREFPEVVCQPELKYKIYAAKKLSSLVKCTENSIETTESAAIELFLILNSSSAQFIQTEITELKEKFKYEESLLQEVITCLENTYTSVEIIKLDFENTTKKLKSVSSLLNAKIPESPKEMTMVLNQAKIEIENITASVSNLDDVSHEIIKLNDRLHCQTSCEQINVLKLISQIMLKGLQEQVSTLQNNSEKSNKFNDLVKFLFDWCDQIENIISCKYFASPENIRKDLNQVIYQDISEKQELYSSISSKGQMLIKDKRDKKNISKNLSALQKKFENINNLFSLRVQDLSEIISKKQDMNVTLSSLIKFLKKSEEILLQPLELNNVSEIETSTHSFEELLLQTNKQSDVINSLQTDLSYIISQPVAFSCCLEKDMYLHSFQNVFKQCELLKRIAMKRVQYVKNVEVQWHNIFILLKNLEDWLSAKEKIATKIDYSKTNPSRAEYLEGIEVFEKLNHDIQDNIHLLHNVNTSFHAISKKELDEDDSLKNRVLAVNNRWRAFYEKVSSTLDIIRNALQMWDNYDKFKEHLLLLLTETDIKVTKFEQSKYFSSTEYTSIMKEIYLHEEELLKFISLGSHLKVLSECSIEIIEKDVKDIQTYWNEILHRLMKCRQDSNGDNYIPGSKQLALDEKEKIHIQSETQVENLLRSLDVVDNNGQRECIKDLLAALEEADERIRTLESVLLEPTPNGVDEGTGPNYSRLLAACRSSIDVIQHLNQVLSESPCLENSSSVLFRAEDMINRWEKIENKTLDKELRAIKNAQKWKEFSEDLKNIEKWLLDALQTQSSHFASDINVEDFITLLQKHQDLISEIKVHKKSIITLNTASQKFSSTLKSNEGFVAVNEKLKVINEHWDKLCLNALDWQKKLQTDFFQCCELTNTLQEMELWLKDSKNKVHSVPTIYDKDDTEMFDQHTEIFAIKQQLENCLQQVKMLLKVSSQLFYEENSTPDPRFVEVELKLNNIYEETQSLLVDCTERLTFLSSLCASHMVLSSEENESRSESLEENQPTRIRQCCQYLLRVARASIPIQAILLLLLGAAILIPREEEELSCRFSNNFASSLSTMLRYPDGPPPV